jgi:hypothetical protein
MGKQLRGIARIGGLLLAVVASSATQEPSPERDPLARLAVLGASASAGFNLGLEGPVTLHHFLLAALEPDPGASIDLARAQTFLAPEANLERALAAATEFAPTATLALDLPFWFVHGPHPAGQRLLVFERFLAQLDDYPGRLLLGSIPPLGPEVSTWMVPRHLRASDPEVEQANLRLRAYAAAHEHVRVAPVAELLADLRAGREVVVGDSRVSADEVEDLLQGDGLHPTVEGTAALTLLGLAELDLWLDGALEGRVVLDLPALVERLSAH